MEGDRMKHTIELDDMFYDYEFSSINEEKDDIFIDINETGGKY